MEEVKPNSRRAVWTVAVRPFAYPASLLPAALGATLAWRAGSPILPGRLALTLLGVFLFHTAANLLNDGFDFLRGTDVRAHPDSGAVVRGWIRPGQACRAAWLCFGLGTLCGVALAALAGWPVLALGVLGAMLAAGYTREGWCLKYAGLGDAAIFIAFGPLPALGAYWVQAESFAGAPLLWSLPSACLTVGILHANNWRDRQADARRQCRTLAGRLGERGAQRYYRLLMLCPFLLVAGGWARHAATVPLAEAPWTLLLPFLAWPLARRLMDRRPSEFPLQVARTAQLQLCFSTLLLVGVALART